MDRDTIPHDQPPGKDQPSLSSSLLSDTFLEALVAEIDAEHIRGIILGGSQARGDATPYSDVDLACFVLDSFQPLRKRYLYREDRLISVGLKTLKRVQQQLTDPYQALWIVPSFRQVRILLDKDGSMRQLQQMVEQFTWEPLRKEAIGYAGHILTCDAEFVHKLLGNIWKGNLSGVAYATARLFDGATMVLALFHAVFITTDSLYYQEVEAAAGMDSTWTHYHRLLVGIQANAEENASIEARGKLALRLYRETARTLLSELNEERRAVVEQVLHLIEQVV
ncbi:MAG TPA: nucleotidyltransferase domain-containing protein [Ktedonobacteraceae bacterium]